jgi:cell division protein FtsI/penicillin-binding protein 2
MEKGIPEKANSVLQVLLCIFVFFSLRVMHLGYIQHQARLEQVQFSQRNKEMIPAIRGTIRDRHNIVLAYNKVQYDVAICYADIRQNVPAISYKNKQKTYPRQVYIHKLAAFLEESLQLPKERTIDLIYGRSALAQQLPFTISKNISEQTFYKLKIKEYLWPGLKLQINPRRSYPFSKLACDVLGYMGAISEEKYHDILLEMAYLEASIENRKENHIDFEDSSMPIDALKQRMEVLKQLAYSCTALVGQAGVEARFDEELRGRSGEVFYLRNAKGDMLEKLPGKREAQSGDRLLLTLSSPLQEYAERLLIESDQNRSFNVAEADAKKRTILKARTPWIKGGAIVAFDPKNGQVLALASYPRIDPNDFTPFQGEKNVGKWLEKSSHIASVWDGRAQLERERINKDTKEIFAEKKRLNYFNYLEAILPMESPLYDLLKEPMTIGEAVKFQKQIHQLLSLSATDSLISVLNALYEERSDHVLFGSPLLISKREALEKNLRENQEQVQEIKKNLAPYFEPLKKNYDKLFFVDLNELFFDSTKIEKPLLEKVYKHSLADYRTLEQAASSFKEFLYKKSSSIYSKTLFKEWREKNQKAFFKKIRKEEKIVGVSYPLSYLDYLDAQEEIFFQKFWKENQEQLLMQILFPNKGLNHALTPFILPLEEVEIENIYKDMLTKCLVDLSLEEGIAYLKTMRSLKDLNNPLKGKYKGLLQVTNRPLQKHLAQAFYPAYGFGYGRSFAFRQATTPGSIFKLITAYQGLYQKYYEVGNVLDLHDLNPMTVVDRHFKKQGIKYLGYSEKGEPIAESYKGGRILKSYHSDMGKLDILHALKKSSNFYFSLLAGEYLKDPQDLTLAAEAFGCGKLTGIDLPFEYAGNVPQDLRANRSGLFSTSCGQHSLLVTPLQAAHFFGAIANGGALLKPEILFSKTTKDTESVIDEVNIPPQVQKMLLEGMRLVTEDKQLENSLLFIGKSGTAEAMEVNNLDDLYGNGKYHHIWFGAISYDEEGRDFSFLTSKKIKEPKIVVLVYLRYGTWGREAGLIAEKILRKWDEIEKKH